MGKEFVPYELALKLKKLGFDESCLACYHSESDFRITDLPCAYDYTDKPCTIQVYPHVITAPLWQQVFDWFDVEKKLRGNIIHADSNGGYTWVVWKWNFDNSIGKWERKTMIDSYADRLPAKIACLKYLIELTTPTPNN